MITYVYCGKIYKFHYFQFLHQISRMVSNHFKELEQKELRAEKEEAIKLKKIASQMAKMVKEFWTNIEKVQYSYKYIFILFTSLINTHL